MPLLRIIVPVSYTHLDVYKRQSIEYMLVNPDKRTEMGMYNYKKVKEYDSKIVQKEMEKIYAAI